MLKLLRQRRVRPLAFIMAFLMLLPLVASLILDIKSEERYTHSGDVSDMICRIKNVGTGLYLDTYRMSVDTKAKTYLGKYLETDYGQLFYIKKNDDGTYKLICQNDNGEYAISYDKSGREGTFLNKSKATQVDAPDTFEIIEVSSGRYVFAPAKTENIRAVLAVSDEQSIYNESFACLGELDDDEKQHWIIEPVKTERITVAFTSTKERLYTTGKYYARKYPYNTITSDLVWSSSNEDVLLVGDDGSWCAVGLGTATVTVSCEDVKTSFKVTVTDKNAYTWYSQNNIYTSDWDATDLKFLYFSSGGRLSKFAIDEKEYGAATAWIDIGCGNCATAMVLKNMGAVKTHGYDFRTDQTGGLTPDPYTVALANSGNFGADSTKNVLYGNPVYMNWSYTVGQFNVDGKAVELSRVYYPSKNQLKLLLDENPEGIVAQLTTSFGNHYVVFTKCLNPEEKNSSKYIFEVCDSAAYNPEDGENVQFENSLSYKIGYRLSNIQYVMILD